ncbi:hypothetical protein SKAU_G00346790 [Synaphobranchus kaupii]|uniref:Large ribosomal subunit protein uL23m n=1 Tax=Synaphobranchus kaupii TaxID=118154 RepID=A0A9Q1EJL5_SYNKA|nr:hypothetical protein SKAU_G00346790 [Synaphobranchus kaupii]
MARRVLYPLYQIGNPQLRVFRPNFFLTLVRPGKEQPPDTVQFRIPVEMTKCDVKNYLEKIYSVPVGAVRTRIQYEIGGGFAARVGGPANKSRVFTVTLRTGTALARTPRRGAAVTWGPRGRLHGDNESQQQTFEFPDIFPEKDGKPADGSMDEVQEKFMEDEKQRQRADPRRGGVTDWFGL